MAKADLPDCDAAKATGGPNNFVLQPDRMKNKAIRANKMSKTRRGTFDLPTLSYLSYGLDLSERANLCIKARNFVLGKRQIWWVDNELSVYCRPLLPIRKYAKFCIDKAKKK